MIVVSDSSPLNILVRIRCIDVLPALFQSVIIPPAVDSELSHPSTPEVVRAWLSARPSWLSMKVPAQLDPTLDFDDPGEREAISLALELHADFLLADDRKARKAAQARGLSVTGAVGVLAVGVLELASARGLLTLSEAFTRLRATDFSIADSILDEVLRRDTARRGLT
jgi:predicted nucleic acid-binding protein